MPISLRLDDRTDRAVRRLAKRTGRTTSDVIRQAIAVLEQQESQATEGDGTAYDQLAHLIGGRGSGRGRLSERTGEGFRTLVTAKHRARRSR